MGKNLKILYKELLDDELQIEIMNLLIDEKENEDLLDIILKKMEVGKKSD